MRLLGRIVVALFVVAGSVAATTAEEAEIQAVALTSSVEVSVEHSRRIAVHLAQDATIDLRHPADGTDLPPGVQVDGGVADYVGVGLVEPDSTEGLSVIVLDPPVVPGRAEQAAIVRGIPASEDRDELHPGVVAGEPQTCEQCRIPAGDYELLVVAEGGPATITLQLSGAPARVTEIDGEDHPRYFPLSGTDVWFPDYDPEDYGISLWGGSISVFLGSFGDAYTEGFLVHQWDIEVPSGSEPVGVSRMRACQTQIEDGSSSRGQFQRNPGPTGAAVDRHSFRGHAIGTFRISGDHTIHMETAFDNISDPHNQHMHHGYVWLPVDVPSPSEEGSNRTAAHTTMETRPAEASVR